MCSLLAARKRLWEEERFLMSVFIRRSARVIRVSATSEQMCNWCWDSPGVPPGSTLSLFSLRWALWREGAAVCARSLPPLITEDNTESRMKRVKETNDIPEGGYASILALFYCQLCFISPCWCNCSPHTSGNWHLMQKRGWCAGDVFFCLPICMDVTREW